MMESITDPNLFRCSLCDAYGYYRGLKAATATGCRLSPYLALAWDGETGPPRARANAPINDIRFRIADVARVELARTAFGLELVTDGRLLTADPFLFAEAVHAMADNPGELRLIERNNPPPFRERLRRFLKGNCNV